MSPSPITVVHRPRPPLLATAMGVLVAAVWFVLVAMALVLVAPGGPAAITSTPAARPALMALRVAIGSGAAWLLICSAGAVVSTLTRHPLSRPGPAWVRRIATGAIVTSLWWGPPAGAITSSPELDADEVPRLVEVSDDPTPSDPSPPTPTTTSTSTPPTSTAPSTAMPSTSTTSTSTTTTTGSTDSAPSGRRVASGHTAGPATVVVRPGDSFWSLAVDHVGDDDPALLVRYWRRLMEANADRLVVGGNFDLIRPGQELVIPAR